jgi:hypothetical protein
MSSVTGSIGAQVIAAGVPGLRRLMQLTPLGLLDLAVIATAAIGTLLINYKRGRNVSLLDARTQKMRVASPCEKRGAADRLWETEDIIRLLSDAQ